MLVALAHHDPAHIGQNRLAVLIAAGRAHINRAGLVIRVLFEADHFGSGGERIAGINGCEKSAIGVAQIRDRIERYVGHGLAEHDMDDEKIIDRCPRIAGSTGELIR